MPFASARVRERFISEGSPWFLQIKALWIVMATNLNLGDPVIRTLPCVQVMPIPESIGDHGMRLTILKKFWSSCGRR